MRIGKLTQDAEGNVAGKLHILGMGIVPVALEKETSKKDGKPYFRIIADPTGDAYEIGAAFERNKDGMIYHSVSIDSPAFSAPLNGALFADREHDGVFNVVWDRPRNKDKQNTLALGEKAEAGSDTNGTAVNAEQSNDVEPPKAAVVAASGKSASKRRMFSKGATP